MARTYAPEKRAEALAVYQQSGLAEAHRQTDVPKATLRDWARSAGIDTAVIAGETAAQTAAASAARQSRCEQLRAEAREMFLVRTLEALERMTEPHYEYKGSPPQKCEYDTAPSGAWADYAKTAGICLDKYRLEMGEATDRVERAFDWDGEMRRLRGDLEPR